MRGKWWNSSSGQIELRIQATDADDCSRPGTAADDNVRALSARPYIRAQVARLDAATVAAVLKEYGAWDATELADADQNVQRLLWIACGDIREETAINGGTL